MLTLTIDLKCECGQESKGHLAMVVKGGKAPLRCPHCRKVFLALTYLEEPPEEFAIDLGDEKAEPSRVH